MRKSMLYLSVILISAASAALISALVWKPGTEELTPLPETRPPAAKASPQPASVPIPQAKTTTADAGAGADRLGRGVSYAKANDMLVKKPLTKEDIEKHREAVRERKRQEAIAQGRLAEFEAREAEREEREKRRETKRAERKKLLSEKKTLTGEMKKASSEGKRMSHEERREFMAKRTELDKKLRGLE